MSCFQTMINIEQISYEIVGFISMPPLWSQVLLNRTTNKNLVKNQLSTSATSKCGNFDSTNSIIYSSAFTLCTLQDNVFKLII